MSGARSMRLVPKDEPSMQVFDAVRRFLIEHRLSPDPLHYEFAFRVLSDAKGPLALAVARLTDGGFRLTGRDISDLGGKLGAHAASDTPTTDGGSPTQARAKAEGLIADTQMQVQGFFDVVQTMTRETKDFGRDLAASAHAMQADARQGGGTLAMEEVLRVTGSMLEQVRSAERRLDAATHEADELRAKLEEARESARVDPLTGLPNRRAFEEAFSAAERAGAPLCIALCDVDHFKSVNDRFGHAVGDRVLRAISEALVKNCPGALVTRYGGEEFALIFVGVQLDAACAALEIARVAVSERRFRLRETDEPLGAVTFSGGVTAGAPGERFAAIVGRADRLLYVAKGAGRNTIQAA